MNSKKRGLKIDNSNSSIPVPKTNRTEEFNEQANAVHSKNEEYKQRAWDLSPKFKSIIEDRTLIENKSPVSKNLEQEVLNNLVQLASEMNLDANQPEGRGSVVLSMLLMKMLLVQRDIINSLAYKINTLEKNNDSK
jgi:hypothetical protein